MASGANSAASPGVKPRSPLLASEDWWSVYLGLGLLLVTYLAFAAQSPLNILSKAIPPDWPKNDLATHFAGNWRAYAFMFLLLLGITAIAIAVMGGRVLDYVPSFTVLFVASLLILVLGSQATLKKYGLEYPFWALVIGLVIGNI